MKANFLVLTVVYLLVGCGRSLDTTGQLMPVASDWDGGPKLESAVSNGGNDLSFLLEESIRRLFLKEVPDLVSEIEGKYQVSFCNWLNSSSLHLSIVDARVGETSVRITERLGVPVLLVDSAFAEAIGLTPVVFSGEEVLMLWDHVTQYALATGVLPEQALRRNSPRRKTSEMHLLSPVMPLYKEESLPHSSEAIEMLISSAIRDQVLPLFRKSKLLESGELSILRDLKHSDFTFIPTSVPLKDGFAGPAHARITGRGAIEVNRERWLTYFAASGEMFAHRLPMLIHEMLRSAYFRNLISQNDDFNQLTFAILKSIEASQFK